MNPDHRLTDALDDIAGAAGRSTSHLTDDELVAGVRRRATVLRRRRAAGRAATAAAAVIAVAAGGVVAAQQLGGTRAAPGPAAATEARCGEVFTPPTPTLEGLRLTLSPGSEVLAERGLTELPSVVATLDADASLDALTLTSDGNVEYTLVQDGRVVANGGSGVQPLVTTPLTAGGPASAPFVGLLPEPCDPSRRTSETSLPSGTLPAGEYEVWATVRDARLHEGKPGEDVSGGQPAVVVGGPWTVTLPEGDATVRPETLACGAPATDLVASTTPDTPRLTVTAPRTLSPGLDDAPEARIEVAADDPRPYRVERLSAYLLDGDTVVGASHAYPRELDLDLVVAGDDARARVPVQRGSCDSDTDLSGPLTLLVVADVTDLVSSSSEVLRLVSERRPVTLEPEPAWEVPDDVAPTMAYGCGGPTADDTAWLGRSKDVFAQGGTPLRIAGTTARTTSMRGTTLDLGTTLTVDGDVLADGVQAFLLKDGRVVARAHTPTPDGTWTTFPAGPGDGGIDAWPAADVPRLDGPLDVDVPGRSCETGALLPAGDYELVVGLYGSVGFQVEVTVVESLGTVTITD